MIQKLAAQNFMTQCIHTFYSLTSQPQHGLQHTQKTLIDNIFSNNIEDGLI